VDITNEECPTVNLETDLLSGGKLNNVYEDGDFVKFVEVRGMTEINGLPPCKIKNKKAYSF
jgi:hypothetical protein